MSATATPAGEATLLREPAVFFETAWQRFDQATGAPWHADHTIGGDAIRFEGKGAAMQRALLPALAHLRNDTEAPQTIAGRRRLHLRTWDATEGKVSLPPLKLHAEDKFEHGRISHLSDGRHLVVWEPHFSSVTLLDRATGRAIYFAEGGETLPYYETAAPLRALWHAWFSIRGAFPVHGACVGRDGQAVLLTAPGGNGKSTTALLSLQAGLDYLADDWCLLEPGASPATHSLFNTSKLRPDNLHRFPALRERIHNFDKLDEQKATIFLHQHFPAQLRRSAALKAIVIPSVSGKADTTFERATSALAWHALLKVTAEGVAGSGRELFTLLGQLARCAPVYSLRLGHDLAQVPRAIEAILRT